MKKEQLLNHIPLKGTPDAYCADHTKHEYKAMGLIP